LRATICLPTYNERENLPRMIDALAGVLRDGDRVLVIDDASPDGTGELADRLAGEHAFVDVLWRTCGHPVESDLVGRAEELPVLSVIMPVLGATDIVVTKLMALDEHYCDFARLLPVARALREQVDWQRVRRDVAANDFAVVFLQLLGRLGIVDDPAQA